MSDKTKNEQPDDFARSREVATDEYTDNSDRVPEDEQETLPVERVEDTDDDLGDDPEKGDEPETFPREYVEQLRSESARYRQRAREADTLAERLHTALVAATGRLQDPSDLPFDQSHIDDENALTEAIEDLLSRKPHLASRKPFGDIGQGAGSSTSNIDLAGMLRARA